MLESFVLPLAKWLKTKGHNVEFACTDFMPRNQTPKINSLRGEGFIVHQLMFDYRVNLFKDLVAIIKIVKYLRKEKYDIVHIQSSKAGILGRISSKIAKVPLVIYTANDFYYLESSLSKQKKIVYLFAEKVAARFCDYLLFISRSVLEEAQKIKLKNDNKLIYIGPPIQNYRVFEKNNQIIDKIKIEFSISDDELIIGCVARLVQNKGIDLFIDIVEKLDRLKINAKYVLVGDGPLYNEMTKKIKNAKLENKIIMSGFIENYNDVLNIMSTFDIFCLPTRREGFGLVFAEAMSYGIPVVGPNIKPICEFVENNKSGLLCKPECVDDFVNKIKQLYENRNLRELIGKNGRDRICKIFDQEKYFQSHLEFYSNNYR